MTLTPFGFDGNEIIIDGSIDTKELTIFAYLLPGLVVFGLMQTLGLISMVAITDVESGLIRRLKLTKMHSYEYPASLILSQLISSSNFLWSRCYVWVPIWS